jgi:hypothetical protein
MHNSIRIIPRATFKFRGGEFVAGAIYASENRVEADIFREFVLQDLADVATPDQHLNGEACEF